MLKSDKICDKKEVSPSNLIGLKQLFSERSYPGSSPGWATPLIGNRLHRPYNLTYKGQGVNKKTQAFSNNLISTLFTFHKTNIYTLLFKPTRRSG